MDVTRQPALAIAVAQARRAFAETRLLFIAGPTGSGKTHLAAWLHRQVAGADTPLIFQEAAGLDAARFESTLFGHVKGAFSGAVNRHGGLLGAADKGVLCIEGVGNLAKDDQARLLRFLQERTYRPLGGNSDQIFKGYILLTDTQTPHQLLNDEKLRDDVYFRINANVIRLPKLAERLEDFHMLCHALLKDIQDQTEIDLRIPTDSELTDLQNNLPPGNLHGLRNILQQAGIRSEAPVYVPDDDAEDEAAADLPNTGSLKADLHIVEARLIERALRNFHGSRDELAVKLGISRRSLMYKLKEHNLS